MIVFLIWFGQQISFLLIIYDDPIYSEFQLDRGEISARISIKK